ncbi:MAG: hypothetical protein SP1CHLAM54_09010 [Chlamydiia bacterium]|nr:hypothetical protein [Chlamydiia bacterium]MCH9615807.1 hypothetical protein [Chlamydiia bacterium]MCH9628790.1 hypothetical protein [Chlamydiia bacterium]
MTRLFICLLLTTLSLFANSTLFLLKNGKTDVAINRILEKEVLDFDVLKRLATILIEQGAKSGDPETELLALYGAMYGGHPFSMDICHTTLSSPHPYTQMATIQFLGSLQDDRGQELLMSCFSSPHLQIRMEAAYQLAREKNRLATPMIEALINLLPPFFKAHFPELLALIGTDEATATLKRLARDPFLHVRLSTFLTAAQYGRDDFLPLIRALATHSNVAEKEAACTALGVLADSTMIPRLQTLSRDLEETVRLAACRALTRLGDPSYESTIIKEALNKNLFAITLLRDSYEGRTALASLIYDPNIEVRINAAIALLSLKDPRAAAPLLELLISDERDLGLYPFYSQGGSLMYWRIAPSITHLSKKFEQDLMTLTLNIKEKLLMQCLELSEPVFLKICRTIENRGELPLVPLATHLIENLATPSAIDFLKESASKVGHPLIRTYATIALTRLNVEGPYRERLHQFVLQNIRGELIQLRPILPWHEDKKTSFDLTPKENSALLIEALLTLASDHSERTIRLLLRMIRDGHPKNRAALSGILLHTLN